MAGTRETQESTTAPEVDFPFRVCSVSEKGLREQNEDNMVRFNSPIGHVVIVADGMGGHGHGDLASALVVNGFQAALSKEETFGVSVPEALRNACATVNANILQMAADITHSVMGSTVVMIVLHHRDLYIAHVGDSRAYLIRDGALTRLTKDHSLVQREVDEGLLTEEQAKQDSRSSTLTRALGTPNGDNIEIRGPEPLLDGDGILLCTDGLHGFALDRQIEDAILFNQLDPQKVTSGLVNLALGTYFSNDNVTVQYVQIGKPRPGNPVRPVFGRPKTNGEATPSRNQSTPSQYDQKTKRSFLSKILLWLSSMVIVGGVGYAGYRTIQNRKNSVTRTSSASKTVVTNPPQVTGPPKPKQVGVVIRDPTKGSLKDFWEAIDKCKKDFEQSSNSGATLLLLPKETSSQGFVSNPKSPCRLAKADSGASTKGLNPYNVDALIIYEIPNVDSNPPQSPGHPPPLQPNSPKSKAKGNK